MRTLTVSTSSASYPIHIGTGLLESPDLLSVARESADLLLVSNDTVFPLYGERVRKSLRTLGKPVHHFLLPDGEHYKTLHQAEALVSFALEHRLSRRTLLVALGGGVVGDLAGFVAAIYLRGIPFVQIPTTLLAQVDSSVGGKVAVNHRLGKNMIGAFYQPQAVWADVSTLTSLPVREWRAGLAEVVKYGVMWDVGFLQFLTANRQRIWDQDFGVLEEMIYRCCAIKAQVVGQDEREEGLRAILNFGHTVGHAIERATRYQRFRHGEAVAIGMVAACHLAREYELFSDEETQEVVRLLGQWGLPVSLPADVSMGAILRGIGYDKNTVGVNITFILPETIGQVRIVSQVEGSRIERALQRMSDRCHA